MLKYGSALLRVSRTWLQFILAMRNLWSHLDFSTAKRPVSLGAVRRYIKRGSGTTTRVTLDGFGSHVEKVPRYIATRCRGLKDLRMTGGLIGASILEAAPYASNLRVLVISKACEISCDVVSQLLSHCPKLERAEFQAISQAASGTRLARWDSDMPNLRALVLDTQNRKRQRTAILALDKLLTKVPNIQTLSLQGWIVTAPPIQGPTTDFSKLHKLQHLNISYLTAVLPPLLPSTVRTFAMADCCKLPGNQGFSFADFDLPQLVRLSFAGWHQLLLGDLQAWLIPNKGKLTHLDIGDCIALSSANLKDLITQGYLGAIEELALTSCNVDDETAVLIARSLPRLKDLDLAWTKITGVGVKALVTGLEGKLEHLCLNGCDSTNIDAVELARAMGVKVSFGFPDPLSAGRRILR